MTDAKSIKNEIAAFLDQKASRVKESMMLSELVPDSFLLVELHAHLQHKFDVEISSEEAAIIVTVGELVDRIQSPSNA